MNRKFANWLKIALDQFDPQERQFVEKVIMEVINLHQSGEDCEETWTKAKNKLKPQLRWSQYILGGNTALSSLISAAEKTCTAGKLGHCSNEYITCILDDLLAVWECLQTPLDRGQKIKVWKNFFKALDRPEQATEIQRGAMKVGTVLYQHWGDNPYVG